MAEQLLSVPEESTTGFTAPSPPSSAYRESIQSVAWPQWQLRSALSSLSGQSGSNYSSISGASSSYRSNIPGCSFEAEELHQGRPSIHNVSSSLRKQLAHMSEESTTGSTAPCPPSNSYRESIMSVAWPEWRIISTLSCQSGSNYSSYSGASSSYMSKNSGCSVGAEDFGSNELTKIAQRMVSDGYTQRMVQAFEYGGEQDGALHTWFAELNINWIFQMPKLADMSALCIQELAERWIRALTIIVVSIKELVAAVHETPAVGRFAKVSISAMLVFVDAIVNVSNMEKLQAMLHMYICVSNASYDMLTMQVISSDAQRIFNEIDSLLERKGDELIGSMPKMMSNLKKTHMKDDDTQYIKYCGDKVVEKYRPSDSWPIEITEGRGEVHKNTRLMVHYIVLMRKAHDLAHNSVQSNNTAKLRDLICDSIDYLKDLLMRKSKLCPVPSLGYLFLLNNSYFVVRVTEPSISLDVELSSGQHRGLKLIPECENYMESYIEVSWKDVLSCLSPSNFHGTLHRWFNTPSLQWPHPSKIGPSSVAVLLAKFVTKFHKTYQAQKFWKVPDPQLRSLLRETISKRVISGYRDFLKEHPELEKQVSAGNSSPDDLEEMLGELFEG